MTLSSLPQEAARTDFISSRTQASLPALSFPTLITMALAALVFGLLWRRLGGFRAARGDWPALLFMGRRIGPLHGDLYLRLLAK